MARRINRADHLRAIFSCEGVLPDELRNLPDDLTTLSDDDLCDALDRAEMPLIGEDLGYYVELLTEEYERRGF